MIPVERLPALQPTIQKNGITLALTLPIETGVPVLFSALKHNYPQKNSGDVWRVHVIGGNPSYLVTVAGRPNGSTALAAGDLKVPTAGNYIAGTCFRSDIDFLVDGSDSDCTDFYFTWNSPVPGTLILTKVWPVQSGG